MSAVLAIETSTPHASLALWENGVVLHEENFESQRAHNSLIFPALQRLLDWPGELRLLVVGTGPGSYTGVRIGISTALGLALSREIPLIGLPSLPAVVAAPPHFAVIGDARRGLWHFSECQSGRLTAGPKTGTAEEIAEICASSGLPLLTFDPVPPPFGGAQRAVPSAARLAEIAAGLTNSEREALASRPVEPLYLAAPYITTPKPRPSA